MFFKTVDAYSVQYIPDKIIYVNAGAAGLYHELPHGSRRHPIPPQNYELSVSVEVSPARKPAPPYGTSIYCERQAGTPAAAILNYRGFLTSRRDPEDSGSMEKSRFLNRVIMRSLSGVVCATMDLRSHLCAMSTQKSVRIPPKPLFCH
jgi:hypothetical protein